MKEINLVRKNIDGSGCFSEMTDVDGVFLYFAGEHAYEQEDRSFLPKIPNGKWQFVRYFSPHHGYEVFMCNSIPGHDFIEIHIGNYPQIDSDGCIILGKGLGFTTNGSRIIQQSKLAFQEFMGLQKDVNSFILNVE